MKSILITGGTGTFGQAYVKRLLYRNDIKRIVIYSRDEQKQEEMERHFGKRDNVRYFIGDVRDCDRLKFAMRSIEIVIHAAALKIVPKCEYDPIEAVRTNVGGAENVIKASIDSNVQKVIALSTDKAVSPVNLYGSTKLTAERLFIAANHLSGATGSIPNATKFSVVRYGNVANSRGSVIPLFKKLYAEGKQLPITHQDMTRFYITIEDATFFVTKCLKEMTGGEIFIPKMYSFKIIDLAYAINSKAPCPWEVVGIRPGEKIHETLITTHDTPRLFDDKMFGKYTILPEWNPTRFALTDYNYSSDTNDKWLTVDDLRRMI
jgi:UDP-N-acetylglucosamine 4,6-dehydratase